MFGLKSPALPSDPWPLRFKRHNFGARCYRTLRCSVIYDRFQFVPENLLSAPSGDPVKPDWRDAWDAGYIVGDSFAGPVKVDWTSLDGSDHHALVDISDIFEDRLVRHHVSRQDVSDSWLSAKAVDPVTAHILVEINDRTINVFMRAVVFTKLPANPDNPHSTGRRDLVLAWTRSY